MRKLFLILIITLIMPVSMFAELIDVVYLKNGSMIRGLIVEQVPNESLKIQTRDGSVFYCQISEVAKITKENFDNDDHFSIFSSSDTSSGIHKGYRGFVDIGYADPIVGAEILTTHGKQLSPFIFLGGGAGLIISDGLGVPIFADFRADFINKRITPFVDVKLGYSVGDFYGAYSSTSVGARFRIYNKIGFNVSTGYVLEPDWHGNSYIGLSIRLGVDF